MQLTDETLRILNGHEDGLREHFIYLSHTDAVEPSANICAGTRWLFLKKAGAKVTVLEGPVRCSLNTRNIRIRKFKFFAELDRLLRH